MRRLPFQGKPSFFIENDEDLEVFLKQTEEDSACGLDFEADNGYRYEDSLCLIQYANKDALFLIDFLAIKNTETLFRLFSRQHICMHGAHYDMHLFLKAFGDLPERIFDTQVAAQLCGFQRFGLKDIVQHFFDKSLDKSLQRFDWSRRPLSSSIIYYALNDVRYLEDLKGIFSHLLKVKERMSWFEEICLASRGKVLKDYQKLPWKISGSEFFSERENFFLEKIWNLREVWGKTRNIPASHFISNKHLLRLVSHMFKNRNLVFPSRFSFSHKKQVLELLENCSSSAQKLSPEKPKKAPFSESFFQKLRKKRDKVAIDLGISPQFLASRAILEDLARGNSVEFCLLSWQRKVLEIDRIACSKGAI